jgi:hypothetical protein
MAFRPLIVATACLLAPAAWAEKMTGPVYNPATRSYFALVDTYPEGFVWERARRLATTHVFKGVHGRLAIVPDRQTDAFLVKTFSSHLEHPAVIGLRYWCRNRKLQWIDGRTQPNRNFGIWHVPWNRTPQDSCGMLPNDSYMGVHYEAPRSSMTGIMSLRAVGPAKGFNALIVEFPTGGE